MNKPSKNCLTCGLTFFKEVNCSQIRWDTSKRFCSLSCSKKGTKYKLGKTGQKAWNKGLPGKSGVESPTWKGDKVGYHGLHKWVQSVLGKPCTCVVCGVDGLTGHQIHWANKSREYKRIESDWLRLCAGCHLKYDRN